MLAWRNMHEDFYVTLPPRNKILELLKFKRLKHNFHDNFCFHFVSAQVATSLNDGLQSEFRVNLPLHRNYMGLFHVIFLVRFLLSLEFFIDIILPIAL